MRRFFEFVTMASLIAGISGCGHSVADKQEFIRHASGLPDVVCVEQECSADQLALIEEAKEANKKNFKEHPGHIFVYPEAYITTGYNRIGPVVCLKGGPEYHDGNGNVVTEKSQDLQALHLPENQRSAYRKYAQENDATHLVFTVNDRLWSDNCAPNEGVREEARALKAELEAQGIGVE